MAKGKREPVNPVTKLEIIASQLVNLKNSLIEAASKPDFAQKVAALKAKQAGEDQTKSKLNKESSEIVKHLKAYPGLSRQILTHVRSKIAEYKTLNILETFKNELPPVERKKRGPKAGPAKGDSKN